MKKLFYLMAMSIMLITSACSKEEEEYMLSASDLEQTTWKAVYTIYDYQGKEHTYNYIVQFLTRTSGTYVELPNDRDYSFSYSIDRKIMSFRELFRSDLTIMEASHNKFVLQSDIPTKATIVWEKQY